MNRGAAALSAFLAMASTTRIAVAGTSAATADAVHTVVVLRGAGSDAVTTEATARVQGELGAAGFRVAVVPFAPSSLDPDSARRAVETAGSELSPTGAFAIVVHPADHGVTAEIWVSDRVSQRTVVETARLTEADRDRESEILAVRAVELLKASLAEFWVEPATTAPPPLPPPPKVAEKPAPPPPVARRRAFAAGLGLGVGVGVVDGFRDVGALWMPTVLASYGWESGVALQLAFHGLGPTATLTSTFGTATVEEQFATVDVMKTWWPRWPVVPLACAGVGVHHVHVTGSGVAPYTGTQADDWSPLTSLGLAAGIPLYSGLSVIVQTRAVVAWPPTSIRIAQSDVGHLGGPSLLVEANVFGVFP
jgi:hypothetical protein